MSDAAKIRRIGVVVPAHIELARSILHGVRSFCMAHPGVSMNLISASPNWEELARHRHSTDCIVAHISCPETIRLLSGITPHVVVTSNRMALDGVGRVINDDPAVGRMGAEYFLRRGFRTLAFLQAEGVDGLSPAFFQFAVEREKGFLEAAAKGGATVHLFARHSQERSPELVEKLLALPKPVGVMTSSDLHARWLIEAMEDPRKLVPQRLSILGVDNDSLENVLSPLTISSVCPSGKRIGYEAAALGIRLVEGAPTPDQPMSIGPVRIVTRQTTSIFAVSDPLVLKALRIIGERHGEAFHTTDLVQSLGTSRRTLELHFRKYLGSTPAKELLHARIQRVTELLATTSLSIKEIAYLSGFSEPRLLSRCFLQMTGERPSAYRERILGEAAETSHS
ncbi:MAG: substrate-binding domain-containing protein [Opitutales bacterium]|nr:substrate-binding domain-containing protein [Opitutales bacterium]